MLILTVLKTTKWWLRGTTTSKPSSVICTRGTNSPGKVCVTVLVARSHSEMPVGPTEAAILRSLLQA